jgi:NAD(P)-dependent dehydrogenase (short-subunit alcohol dehydrogenase family)
MSERCFDGRVAVITGGARGLDFAYAQLIAIEGADRDVKSNVILPGAVTRMADGST